MNARLALLASVLVVGCSDDSAEVGDGPDTSTAESTGSPGETTNGETTPTADDTSSNASSSSGAGSSSGDVDASTGASTGTTAADSTESDASSAGETMPAGACDPQDGDSECLQCTKTSCCTEYEACLDDPTCDCTRECINSMPDSPYGIIGPGCLMGCGAPGIPRALFPVLGCQDEMCEGCVML
jgi:hypothetical protein